RARVLVKQSIQRQSDLAADFYRNSGTDFGVTRKSPAKINTLEKALRDCGTARARRTFLETLHSTPVSASRREQFFDERVREMEALLERAGTDPGRAWVEDAVERAWFCQGFLADRFPRAFRRMPADVVTVEIAQHHPDAPPETGKHPFIYEGRARLE